MEGKTASDPGGRLPVVMLKAENLTKRYGDVPAVSDVSFAVEQGEVVGFLGPNGAGKTTTLRMVTGYLPATSGRAWVAGYDVTRDSLEARRRMGYLPEGVALYPEMRVIEYLTFRARIKGVAPDALARRVGEVVARCGLDAVARKLIGTLSKGYRQRVGLADALVHDPPVLLLDEPTVGLDPNQVREVRELIRDLGRDHTILLSTHILTEVESLCRRVLILNAGRLVFSDRLDRYAGESGVTVEVEGALPEVTAEFARLPGADAVRVESEGAFHRLRLSGPDGAALCEHVGRCAARRGWTLRALHPHRTTLEDVFVRLTAQEDA